MLYSPLYSPKITLVKGLKYFAIFALAAIINESTIRYPDYMSLTIGAVLVMALNYLKVKAGIKLP